MPSDRASRTPSPRDFGLRSPSFSSDLPDRPRHRAILNIEGAQRCGKDWFAFDAPDPIVVFNFDQGLEGVIERFRRKGKRIIVAGMPGSGGRGKYPHYHFARPVTRVGEKRNDRAFLNHVREAAVPVWEQWIRDYTEFLKSDARTGIIDTGTAAFALGRFAVVGTDKPNQTVDPYGKLSADFKSVFQGLITEGYSHDKNICWLHRLKDEWKGGESTGQQIADGYNQLRYEVQVTLRLLRKVRGKGLVRTVRILDCRLDPYLDGEEFSTEFDADGEIVGDDEFRFAVVMAEIFGTKEEIWR